MFFFYINNKKSEILQYLEIFIEHKNEDVLASLPISRSYLNFKLRRRRESNKEEEEEINVL